MLGSTFYHQTIRKYVAVFGTIFNDLNIERKNSSGTVIEKFKVPLAYGPKQKWLLAIQESTVSRKVTSVRVPRMGFALTGLSYDPVRKLNTIGRNISANTAAGTGSLMTQYNPVPYNFEFTLYILVKNAEDGTQILEQILPYFTPEFTVTINTIPEMGIKADVPITLNSADVADEYEGELATARTITWTLSFTMRGYIYPDIKTGTPIKTITVNFRIPGGEGDLITNFVILETTSANARVSDHILLENDNGERILNENSDDGVGDSTVKSRYTVVPSPTTAEASSDFSETFEFFDDSKNYNPADGTDYTTSS